MNKKRLILKINVNGGRNQKNFQDKLHTKILI